MTEPAHESKAQSILAKDAQRQRLVLAKIDGHVTVLSQKPPGRWQQIGYLEHIDELLRQERNGKQAVDRSCPKGTAKENSWKRSEDDCPNEDKVECASYGCSSPKKAEMWKRGRRSKFAKWEEQKNK